MALCLGKGLEHGTTKGRQKRWEVRGLSMVRLKEGRRDGKQKLNVKSTFARIHFLSVTSEAYDWERDLDCA